MTGLLASVSNVSEAEMALACFADVIDCKDPRQGALGALRRSQIEAIVDYVNGDRPVSATAGDVIHDVDSLGDRIDLVAACGVDFIKFGLFDLIDVRQQLAMVEKRAAQQALIAVGFVDLFDPIPLIRLFAESGCQGFMLDTADKRSGSLTDIWSTSRLRDFITLCREYDLVCGMAGKLAADDVQSLLPLNPDYLGFRSALCKEDRRSALDYTAMMDVRSRLPIQGAVSPISRHSELAH